MLNPVLNYHALRELAAKRNDTRVPEPDLVMADESQAEAFMAAGREDGVIAPTYLFHTMQIARLLRRGDQVLDLACGPANQLAQVARLHPEVSFTGVDASASMLALAEETVNRQGLANVGFREAYIQDLEGIADHSVDLVMSTLSLHHLPDFDTLCASFTEAARVLKPGGRIYLADFGRLKRDAFRRYFATRRHNQQSEIFETDYINSLRAAFTPGDFRGAMTRLGDDVELKATALVPFMLVLWRGQPGNPSAECLAECRRLLAKLPKPQQQDFRELSFFFRMGGLPLPG